GVDTVYVSIKDIGDNQCLNSSGTAFDAACPEWHTATGAAAWSISLADSVLSDGRSYEVISKANDKAANEQQDFTAKTFTWVLSAPDQSFTVNGGASFTNSPNVTLTLSDPTDVHEYR